MREVVKRFFLTRKIQDVSWLKLTHLVSCEILQANFFSITGNILAHKNILLNATILKSSIYVDAPFLSVFVKFVVYLLFHPENISSKVDVIEKAN